MRVKEKQRKARAKKWKAANPEKVKKYSNKWYLGNKERTKYLNTRWRENNFARYLHRRLKYRAKQRKLPFDLTIVWIEKRLKPMLCEVTGLKLSLDLSKDSRYSPWTPSIDQIKPGEGYTKCNSQIVCYGYNVAKGCWGHKEVMVIMEALCASKK